ncbi:MAG TPA: archaellin/type IV pilin N-terminal domain-containing protein [Candidatus Nanoarchaeia archaeon]|nr:archaellin/type IV pilin N-terminal domain-containing protein [Candidatus Nanoarchaeia archaeon]
MRKAITPVIAVVLLLMMTVAAAGAAFFWITTIQSRIQGQIGTQVGTTTSQTSSNLNMISIVCYNITNSSNPLPEHDFINITLQNTGTSTIEKGTSAITISDEKDRVIKVATTELTNNFDQNQIITMDIGILTSNSFIENSTYGIKITLPGGVSGTGDCITQLESI